MYNSEHLWTGYIPTSLFCIFMTIKAFKYANPWGVLFYLPFFLLYLPDLSPFEIYWALIIGIPASMWIFSHWGIIGAVAFWLGYRSGKKMD